VLCGHAYSRALTQQESEGLLPFLLPSGTAERERNHACDPPDLEDADLTGPDIHGK